MLYGFVVPGSNSLLRMAPLRLRAPVPGDTIGVPGAAALAFALALGSPEDGADGIASAFGAGKGYFLGRPRGLDGSPAGKASSDLGS